ncbi:MULTISPECIES: hypothetical protein [Pedobacter]|uniref:hypothetical protein n=1 Tax=Pedobacter TaxID=84567 RepID=UPI00210C8291|nr:MULTISPECIES: hypothetical protein [unclassified Pedobacter]
MKKLLKITGVLAVVLTLVFNLQYAAFDYDVTTSPSKAVAAWTDGNGTKYCGSYPETWRRTGTWTFVNDDFYASYGWYGYDDGFYYFTASNSGTMCGQIVTYDRRPGPSYPADPWAGHDVTNILGSYHYDY